VTSEHEPEEDERALAPDEANIRWLLAAVLHHEPGQSGGGETATSRNGGSQPSSP
jgi:hypothetical protein